MEPKVKIFNRYTDLTALIDILTKKRIVLLDPNNWDDQNDVFFMSTYKEKMKLQTLLALCFTTKYETYHHWSVFASGNAGVCIRFKRSELTECLNNVDGVKFQPVKYKEISTLKDADLSLSDVPFLKRYPYKDEEEYRAIYESDKTEFIKEIPFDISIIDRIVLSPWLPESLLETVRTTIKNIKGCSDVKVYKTTLLSNPKWKQHIEQLV
ncbi:DUF2971 domain-containing protein [Photobacterium phosphoreum]|uniref:DUF2971 domain-containing protein n=1 Tax=Photobacterium phosphoreum TaxID=659 RepID=A0AAW4ZME7_PHOPO|nr:DUF2971 domain-containing protein [Photobacterium phosphoreum]MCD9491388.1 DUF2971 domain-containing protein [Photobacterium phosphoreum]MCF2190776.1 DUF2971 domain-containing protein [Photobacterium phosphoreum]MCF2302297.1 DUF2971 domain-containing protein [Photobacterium phosphoreum]